MSMPDEDGAALVDYLDSRAKRLTITFAGCATVWRHWGAGADVVLVHGGSGSWTHWVHNLDELASRYRVWAPDLPGCGDSGMPAKTDVDAIAAVLSDGIDELIGAARFVLVGFSYGGLVAASAACSLKRARVERLFLVGCAGLGLPVGPFPDLKPWRHLQSLQAAGAIRDNLAAFMIADASRIDPLALLVHQHNLERARLRTRQESHSNTLLRLLPLVQSPLIAIWGGRDRLAGDAEGLPLRIEAVSSVRPDTQIEIISDAGHWVAYEQPAFFNRLILAHLELWTPNARY
jgi:pimeloyl-ACP methyl ester carboxylesterase